MRHRKGGVSLSAVDVQALVTADTPLHLLAGVLGAKFRINDNAGFSGNIDIIIAAGNVLIVNLQSHSGYPGNQNQLQGCNRRLQCITLNIRLDGNGLALQNGLGVRLQLTAGRQIGVARIVRIGKLPQESLAGVVGVLGSQGEFLTGQNLTLGRVRIHGGNGHDGASHGILAQLLIHQIHGLLGRVDLFHGSLGSIRGSLGCLSGLRGRGGLGSLRSGSGGFGSRGFRSCGNYRCLSGLRNGGILGGLRNRRSLRLNSGFRHGYNLCQCLEGHHGQKHHHRQKQGKNTLAHRFCLLILLATIVVVTICTDCNISVIRLQL